MTFLTFDRVVEIEFVSEPNAGTVSAVQPNKFSSLLTSARVVEIEYESAGN